jgi:hypothetical protein
MKVSLRWFDPRIYTAVKCGHLTFRTGRVMASGRKVFVTLDEKYGKVDYCHACLETMTTQCCRCLQPIFIGEPVFLYTSNLTRQIGCLRSGCIEGIEVGRNGGFWLPSEYDRGNVVRVAPSANLHLISELTRHIVLQDIYHIIAEHPYIESLW